VLSPNAKPRQEWHARTAYHHVSICTPIALP